MVPQTAVAKADAPRVIRMHAGDNVAIVVNDLDRQDVERVGERRCRRSLAANGTTRTAAGK